MRKIKKKTKRLAKAIISVVLVLMLSLSVTGCGLVVTTIGIDPEYEEEDKCTAPDFSSLRAQDDYYGYANYERLNNLEYDYRDDAVGGFDREAIDKELIEMMEKISLSNEEYAPGSNEQLVKDAYLQIKDYREKKTSNAGDYFRKKADEINSLKTIADIKEEIGSLYEEGITSFFPFAVEKNYYDGENYTLFLGQIDGFSEFDLRDFYEEDDTRQELHSFVMEVLVAAGEDAKTASKKADDLIYFLLDISFETDFEIMDATNPFLTVEFRTNEEMNEIFENITIEDVEKMFDISNPYGGWYIQDEGQLRILSKAFNDEKIEVIKTWLLCDVMNAYSGLLCDEYPFLEKITGVSEDARNLLYMENLFPIQLSELYAQNYYTDEMDKQIHRMYEDIVAGYKSLMKEATWLSEETRDEMIAKLENMVLVCGTGKPHDMDPNDAGLIGEDIFETYRNTKIYNTKRNAGNIGKRIDKSENSMASYEMNACYEPCNTFTITVAIMHAPFFDINADYATNMGGLGMVMGHEIGHAFDSNCIYYDAKGAYRPERICDADRSELESRLKKIEEYYSGFTVMDIYHVDGVKTSGENYADIGSMECLMKAVTTPEQRERLFENYATIWCEMRSDEALLEQIERDEHSPAMARVNALLSSLPEFYEVYDVKPGDGMYVDSQNRVSRWH